MTLNVFFDIETLTTNRLATPREQQVIEYVVSYKYDYKNKTYEFTAPTLEEFIKRLKKLHVKHIVLLAHNGEGYDFHFLRRSLVLDFGLEPHNMYLKNSLNHLLESRLKDFKSDYLVESRVKAKTRVNLKFRLGYTTFETKDTYPITHMSVRTMGSVLKDLGLDDNGKNIKLNYDDDYTKYDLDKKLSYGELKRYALKVYQQLNKHALDYVMNDTRVIYQFYKYYSKIYAPTYDPTKITLSQNILEQYSINQLAQFQLVNNYGKQEFKTKAGKTYEKPLKLNLTDYMFITSKTGKRLNVYQYIHQFYKGGLNMYNDKYVGKLIHEHIVHIDLNSSYPTVMRYRKYPTFLVDGKVENTTLKLDKNYYYYLQISKYAFERLYLNRIKSKMVKKMFIKYFANSSEFVYVQTPHIMLLEKFIGHKILKVPVVSYLKFKTEPFGGLPVIQYNYQKKTELKKKHASKGEVQAFKVPLNGIYGIPALRPFYPLYEFDKSIKNFISVKDDLGNFGFKNSQRNITFASSVTAWALYQLLLPLTYNIEGIDDNFIYCDTDSHFLKYKYWLTIKDHVDIDKYRLGAWDEEHHYITDMFVMNHKKYCIYSKDNNKVEVFSGGIPNEAFHTEKYNDLKSFVDSTFHNGSKIPNQHNAYTNDLVVTIYTATTEIKTGGKYIDTFGHNKGEISINNMLYELALMKAQEKEENKQDQEDALYYETPFGSFSYNEIFPPIYKNDLSSRLSFKSLLGAHKSIRMKIEKETDIASIEQQRREELKL